MKQLMMFSALFILLVTACTKPVTNTTLKRDIFGFKPYIVNIATIHTCQVDEEDTAEINRVIESPAEGMYLKYTVSDDTVKLGLYYQPSEAGNELADEWSGIFKESVVDSSWSVGTLAYVFSSTNNDGSSIIFYINQLEILGIEIQDKTQWVNITFFPEAEE